MFRSQQIIIREYVCTSLKLLNYLKNTEFKILKISNFNEVQTYSLMMICWYRNMSECFMYFYVF